jgi:hypothetical protein
VKAVRKLKKREIKAEKKHADKAAKKMMTAIIKEKRDIPYNRCTNKRVAFFTDSTYIHNVCYEMFGLSRQEQCKLKEDFCGMCCRHHLGVRMVMKYENCFLRCRNLQTSGKDKNEGTFVS